MNFGFVEFYKITDQRPKDIRPKTTAMKTENRLADIEKKPVNDSRIPDAFIEADKICLPLPSFRSPTYIFVVVYFHAFRQNDRRSGTSSEKKMYLKTEFFTPYFEMVLPEPFSPSI